MSKRSRYYLSPLIIFACCLFLTPPLAYSQEGTVTLTVGKGSGLPGSVDNPVEISLDNPDTKVRLVQIDICDVDNFLTPGMDGCETTERTIDFECTTFELSNGCLRLLLFDIDAGFIEIGTGSIVVLKYDISDVAPDEECRVLNPEEVIVTDELGNSLEVETEEGGFCFPCTSDSDCDDGLFCNGVETCDTENGTCLGGMAACPDDENPCTTDCDEIADECYVCNATGIDDICCDDPACENESICLTSTTTTTSTPSPPPPPPPPPGCTSDADCDDGEFCNGEETCQGGACQAGTDPCEPLVCDEEADACIECSVDADCSDGLYCNGEEICVDHVCQAGSDPCMDDGLFCNGTESCDEENDTCLSSGNPCSPNEICDEEGDVCEPPLPAPLSFKLIPKSAIRSHLVPLPLFMFIVSDDEDTKFDDATTVSFSDTDIVNSPPVTIVMSENLIYVFSLIKPAGLGSGGSAEVEVTVSATEGAGTGTLTLNLLPLMLGEFKERLKGEAI